jgi:8-amino-7-oxononanoate synthase
MGLDFLKDRIEALRREGLLRVIRDRESPQGRTIRIGGRQLINFSSNDYLGLANHPSVISAAKDALERYGAGSGASRLLSGGTELHRQLEEALATFKSTEAALVFNSGYAANVGMLSAIADSETTIFSDELNHASIIDGCRLSRAETVVYPHTDMDTLRRLIKKKRKRALIVTDTVFSMDGDIAPLKDILEIAEEHDALVYIDDAHGTGVLGGGRGALHHFGLSPEPFLLQMATLSKALGSMGAFVAGERVVVEWAINTARTMIFSTALPAHVLAASKEAVRIVMSNSTLVKRIWDNRDVLYTELKELGLDTGRSQTPIIPVLMSSNEKALRLSAFLFERGIYAPAVRRPAVRQPRLRITVTAVHTKEDILRLVDALKEARQCGLC